MIGRAATRIDLKLDDDLKELDDESMIKLRKQKQAQAQLNNRKYDPSYIPGLDSPLQNQQHMLPFQ